MRGLARYRRRARHRRNLARRASGSSSHSPAARRAMRLIRGAARIASRGAGGELLGVYVTRERRSDRRLRRGTRAAAILYSSRSTGTFHSVAGDDVAGAILDFARGVNASQIVIGVSRRGRLQSLFGPGIGATVIRDSGDIDVHVVTHDYAGRGRVRTAGRAAVGRRRTIAGWVLALMGPILLTACLAATRGFTGFPPSSCCS